MCIYTSTQMRTERMLKMNNVSLVGRLTRDPDIKYTSNDKAVANMTLAVNRDNKNEADFIRISAFGKTAEICGKYLSKGRQIGIQGVIRTGSYKRDDGTTVYTTDVWAIRIDLLGSGHKKNENESVNTQYEQDNANKFEQTDEDIPF